MSMNKNKIILCEGPTDAILLSYYLGKVAGWGFCRKPPKDIAINGEEIGQSINWYARGEERLLICGVGGKDNIGRFFSDRILRPIIDAGAFSKIALILDRDDKEIDSVEKHASAIFSPVVTTMKNNCWMVNRYKDAFDMDQALKALLVVIPTEHQGALETIILDAISEDPYDGVIVEKSGRFVEEMRHMASRYIVNNRAQLKAHLGVTWAVQYPEKVFKLINEQIESVAWEKSEVLNKCFEELVKI
jgi:hypothetical protein